MSRPDAAARGPTRNLCRARREDCPNRETTCAAPRCRHRRWKLFGKDADNPRRQSDRARWSRRWPRAIRRNASARSRWLMTASRCRSSASCAENMRPCEGCTPSTTKKFGETLATLICSDSARARERQPHGIENSYVSEALALPAAIPRHLRYADRPSRRACVGISVQSIANCSGDLIRKRPQEHGVEDAENGGVRANAQRQREHGDGSKTGIFSQPSKGVSKILCRNRACCTQYQPACRWRIRISVVSATRAAARGIGVPIGGQRKASRRIRLAPSQRYLLTNGARNDYGASHCPRTRRRSRSSAAPR